jgi:hypothetical protein
MKNNQITYAILNTNSISIHVQIENPKFCEQISWIQSNAKNKKPVFG